MYMMPELGLIIALEPSRKSGFQMTMLMIHPVTTAVHVTMRFFFLPMKVTFNDSSSVKTEDGRISNVQLEDNDLNSALPLIYSLSCYPFIP